MTPPKIEPGNRPLKVCPFCGSQAILGFDRDQTTNQPIYPTVTCSADNCGVKMTGYDDNETLVRNWNRRTP